MIAFRRTHFRAQSSFKKKQEHIDKCLLTRRPDSDAPEMLATVLNEVREEKMSGPRRPITGPPLLQLPSGSVAAAVAVSIVTEGLGGRWGPPQIRRGDHWRHSHHKSTVRIIDGPRHHTVDDVLMAARFMFRRGFRDIWSWSHDHEGAYRQFLLERPEHALLLLFTDSGPTLWMNPFCCLEVLVLFGVMVTPVTC